MDERLIDGEGCAEVGDEEALIVDAAVSKGKKFAKETFFEFLRSLITGVFPTLIDLLFTNLIIFLFFAKGAGFNFWNMLVGSEIKNVPGGVSAAATAIGYGLGAVAAYFCSILFVFKSTKKGKTAKGVILFICIEAFAYGFNVFLGWAFGKIAVPILAYGLRIAVSYIVVFSLRKLLIFMPEKTDNGSAEEVPPEAITEMTNEEI